MLGRWYSKLVRTATTLRLDGAGSGYVVRSVLRITEGAKVARGREIELQMTAAEARSFAAELVAMADKAATINSDAGYRIDRT